MSFDVAINKSQLRSVERLLAAIPSGAKKAISRAINKTAITVRSRIVKSIAKRVTLKQKFIRAAMKIRKASFSRHQATITISGRRRSLHEFQARQTKRGVSYKINRSEARRSVAGAFIATMPSGHEGVFKRRGAARLPINELKGPSVVSVFEQHVADDATRDAANLLEKNLDTQVKLLLEKGR